MDPVCELTKCGEFFRRILRLIWQPCRRVRIVFIFKLVLIVNVVAFGIFDQVIQNLKIHKQLFKTTIDWECSSFNWGKYYSSFEMEWPSRSRRICLFWASCCPFHDDRGFPLLLYRVPHTTPAYFEFTWHIA